LRIDIGPGYRVYLVRSGKDEYTLLAGGAKRTQAKDIRRAHSEAAALEGE
jgi:putative addiction module killer protein